MDLLTGHRFSVSSYGPAAAYVAWLLQQYGADVDHRTALDPEGLGAFLGEGATFAAEPGVPAAAPVAITDAPVTPANRAALSALAREAAVVWITPWALHSAWAERPWSDLCMYATGGWANGVGNPGEEPLAPPGPQDQFMAGLFATIAAVRHLVSGAAPTRGLANVPIVDAILATTLYEAVGYQYLGNLRQRTGHRFGVAQTTLATLPCKDGFVGVHAALHAQWLRFCEVTGNNALTTDPRFEGVLQRIQNVDQLDAYWEPWLSARTKWEVFHELQAAGIPAAGLPTLDEVLRSPQLKARKYFRTVTTPSGATLRVPGAPCHIIAESHAGQSSAPPSSKEPGPWRPGAPLRVLDFSMGWAGPLVTCMLATFGADVIKVESHKRFDWWRGSGPASDPALQAHERSHVFNSTNRGKRDITIDLTSARGRELALELVAGADLVVENYGSAVMEKFGLGWDALSAANPRLVMLRQPGFGATGPESAYRVFGNTIEGMSGLTQLMGYEGGRPQMMSNALGDPVSGLNGVVQALAAVTATRRDGIGRCIEAAQLDGFIPLMAEELIAYQRTGEQPPRRGNRRPGHEPSGLFRAAGDDDNWVALDVQTDAQWSALAAIIAEPWAMDPALASTAARERERTTMKRHLDVWFAKQDRDDVVELLQLSGIPASPKTNEVDQLRHEIFAEIWSGMEREPVGFAFYPAMPIVIDGVYAAPATPAPHLGEHNAEIFAGLGLSEEAVAALGAEGVTGRLGA